MKYTENTKTYVIKTIHDKLKLLGKCSNCGNKRSHPIIKPINQLEAEELFSSLRIKTCKVPLLSVLL